MPAILAALDVTAERRRAAGRDRADHAPIEPEMSGVRSFVSVAVAAEDIRHLERRPHLTAYSGGVTSSDSRSKGSRSWR